MSILKNLAKMMSEGLTVQQKLAVYEGGVTDEQKLDFYERTMTEKERAEMYIRNDYTGCVETIRSHYKTRIGNLYITCDPNALDMGRALYIELKETTDMLKEVYQSLVSVSTVVDEDEIVTVTE